MVLNKKKNTPIDLIEEPKPYKYCPPVVVNEKQYAITITLNPSNHCNSKMTEFNNSIRKIMRLFKPIGNLLLWMELSPQKNHVHYHGFFTCKDRYKFYHTLSKMIEEVGYINLKEIDNYEKWFSYCTEDQPLIRELFPTIPSQLTAETMSTYFSNQARENRRASDVKRLSKFTKYNIRGVDDNYVDDI